MSDSGSDFAADLVAADGTRHPLAGEMRIGRSNDCEITIENDAKVSRKHAVFRVEGDSVTVEDLGSANGTLVNGQRIAGVTALAHGDTLEFEKHRYTLEIAGQELAEDDATIVNPPEDDDVTVVNAPEPPPPPPPPPPPVATDLPGAWVDDPGMGEHTQVMDFGGAPSAPSAPEVERLSDQAHLILLGADGTAAEASELEPAGSSDPDIWEIGREESCEVTLTEPSVSGRHAQLVHDGGRWRIVNLVSANGIFVNNEKRLSAFLSDGDQIQLGNATLVFRAPVGSAAAAAAAPKPASAGSSSASAGGKVSTKVWLIAGAVVLLAAAAAAAFILL